MGVTRKIQLDKNIYDKVKQNWDYFNMLAKTEDDKPYMVIRDKDPGWKEYQRIQFVTGITDLVKAYLRKAKPDESKRSLTVNYKSIKLYHWNAELNKEYSVPDGDTGYLVAPRPQFKEVGYDGCYLSGEQRQALDFRGLKVTVQTVDSNGKTEQFIADCVPYTWYVLYTSNQNEIKFINFGGQQRTYHSMALSDFKNAVIEMEQAFEYKMNKDKPGMPAAVLLYIKDTSDSHKAYENKKKLSKETVQTKIYDMIGQEECIEAIICRPEIKWRMYCTVYDGKYRATGTVENFLGGRTKITKVHRKQSDGSIDTRILAKCSGNYDSTGWLVNYWLIEANITEQKAGIDNKYVKTTLSAWLHEFKPDILVEKDEGIFEYVPYDVNIAGYWGEHASNYKFSGEVVAGQDKNSKIQLVVQDDSKVDRYDLRFHDCVEIDSVIAGKSKDDLVFANTLGEIIAVEPSSNAEVNDIKFIKDQLHKHDANRVGHHLISLVDNGKIIDLYFKKDNNGIVKSILQTVIDRKDIFVTNQLCPDTLEIYVLNQACGKPVDGHIPYDPNKSVYLINREKAIVIEFDKNGVIRAYTSGVEIEDCRQTQKKIIHIKKQDSTGRIVEAVHEVTEIQGGATNTAYKEFNRQIALTKTFK